MCIRDRFKIAEVEKSVLSVEESMSNKIAEVEKYVTSVEKAVSKKNRRLN